MTPALLPVGAAAELATSWSALHDIADSGCPLLAVDLRAVASRTVDAALLERFTESLAGAPWVTVVAVDDALDTKLHPLADACDVVLTEHEPQTTAVQVDDLGAEVARLADRVAASPTAAVALVQLLRLADDRPIEQALHAESLTYGLLQTGETFQRWLDDRRAARTEPALDDDGPVVAVDRTGGLLTITLDRVRRRNALNVAMRDQLVEALELLDLDRSLDGAVLRGAGPNFCAGGDLDEFGTTPNAATGHHVRMVRSLPRLVHRVRDRLRVHVHGTCVGAGIEVPAFAHTVLADPEATFRLPEVGFGLVPGAGGTVSISRRCGRHRTAWWALSGDVLDAQTALRWHLIDRIAPVPPAG